ncbi:MAG: UDP-glucose 4-epimerase GalE, partial [Oscillospiraceae bacterium]|nr:UDP-glucose 4-epimerase GalE [Oscillospiraceae bacterium]
RDYIHVTDLAEAHILALDYLLSGGENAVFNLGNGTGFTVREVIDIARHVTGHPIPAAMAARRPGDPAQLVASSESARTVLGWQPQYADLETIVASAWNWHKNHPNGFTP